MLKDVKIGLRLTIGFGLVLIFMILIIVLAEFGFSRIEVKINEMNKINAITVSLSEDMLGIIREDAIAIRNAFIQPERILEMKARIESQTKQYDEYFQKVLESIDKSATQGLQIVESTRSDRKIEIDSSIKTIHLLMANRKEEAY